MPASTLWPICPAIAGRAKCPGRQVQAFQGRPLSVEMTRGPDSALVPGIDGFDSVGAADDPPDFYVVAKGTARWWPRADL